MSGFKYDIESDMFTCYFLYQLGDDSASIGGEKQAGISGGSQSSQLMEAFLKRNLNRLFYYMMEFVILKSYDDRVKYHYSLNTGSIRL